MILAQEADQNSDQHRNRWIEDEANHQREMPFAPPL
jgi:hypothetical protein